MPRFLRARSEASAQMWNQSPGWRLLFFLIRYSLVEPGDLGVYEIGGDETLILEEFLYLSRLLILALEDRLRVSSVRWEAKWQYVSAPSCGEWAYRLVGGE